MIETTQNVRLADALSTRRTDCLVGNNHYTLAATNYELRLPLSNQRRSHMLSVVGRWKLV